MRGLAKRNDERAGSPAGRRITTTIIDVGGKVSGVRRRTKADEPRTKQQELRGVPEERNCDWKPTEFERSGLCSTELHSAVPSSRPC